MNVKITINASSIIYFGFQKKFSRRFKKCIWYERKICSWIELEKTRELNCVGMHSFNVNPKWLPVYKFAPSNLIFLIKVSSSPVKNRFLSISNGENSLHLFIKEGYNYFFTFSWNVKRQLCPYFITKWREMKTIQIPPVIHVHHNLPFCHCPPQSYTLHY
jgi:hypothetical protein